MPDEKKFTPKEELLIEVLEKLNTEAKKAGLDEEEAIEAVRDSGMLDVSIKTALGSKVKDALSEQDQLRVDFYDEMREKNIRRGSHEMRVLYLKYRRRGME